MHRAYGISTFMGLSCLAFLLSTSGRAGAQCVFSKPVEKQHGRGPIGLVNEARLPARVLEEAIGYWQACDRYQEGFPAFVIDRPEDGPQPTQILIKYVASSTSLRCASLRGNIVTLYRYARRQSGQTVSCGDLAQNLAHELGHFLGLNHAAKALGCKFNIMSTIKASNARRRRVVAEECRAVDQQWLTPFEIAPPLPVETLIHPQDASGHSPARIDTARDDPP